MISERMKKCRYSIDVCCSRSMAEHLMNLCSSPQTQSWVVSMWSSSIFHYSGQIRLTVSPCHDCPPPLSESHICSISHGACFLVFLKSEAIMDSHPHMLSITQQVSSLCVERKFHTELNTVSVSCIFFFISVTSVLRFQSACLFYVSLTQYSTCTTTSSTVVGFVIKEWNYTQAEADSKWSYDEQ